MKIHLKLIASLFVMTLALVAPQMLHATELFLFEELPKPMRGIVVKQVAADRINNDESFGSLAAVNKRWAIELREFVNQDMLSRWSPCWKAFNGVTPQNEDIIRSFYGSKFQYRPDRKSDKGMVEEKFSDHLHPSKITLKLLECGDAADDMVVTTDHRVFSSDHENKLVYLITCQAALNGSIILPKQTGFASKEETSQVLLFLRWSGNPVEPRYIVKCSYASLGDISSKTLFEILTGGRLTVGVDCRIDKVMIMARGAGNFMFILNTNALLTRAQG